MNTPYRSEVSQCLVCKTSILPQNALCDECHAIAQNGYRSQQRKQRAKEWMRSRGIYAVSYLVAGCFIAPAMGATVALYAQHKWMTSSMLSLKSYQGTISRHCRMPRRVVSPPPNRAPMAEPPAGQPSPQPAGSVPAVPVVQNAGVIVAQPRTPQGTPQSDRYEPLITEGGGISPALQARTLANEGMIQYLEVHDLTPTERHSLYSQIDRELRTIRLLPVTHNNQLHGVRVMGVHASQALQRMGLRNGDVLLSIGGYSLLEQHNHTFQTNRLRSQDVLSNSPLVLEFIREDRRCVVVL